jgi:serine/threonine protein kinase, bacterial
MDIGIREQRVAKRSKRTDMQMKMTVVMKPRRLIALAATAGMLGVAVSTAGCSKTSPSTPPNGIATHTTTTQPSRQVSYSPQVVLPFTNLDNPEGVAVDTAGNLYVVDTFGKNRVLKLAAGASAPIPLPFTDLDSPEGVAVDTAGNLYVTDFGTKQVLKLSAQ